MTSLTTVPADLDDPCWRVSKNDARVHGLYLRPVNMGSVYRALVELLRLLTDRLTATGPQHTPL